MQFKLNLNLQDLEWTAKNAVCCCAEQGKGQCECRKGSYVVLCVGGDQSSNTEQKAKTEEAVECC